MNLIPMAVALIALLSISYAVYRDIESASQVPSLENFAACLNERNVKMYGTDWCPSCQNQKDMFGVAFSRVNYVNCDFHEDECRNVKITSYPTWYFQNEVQGPGIRSLSELGESSGCISLLPVET